jgi:very-short-patch-repair endonuclease
MSAKRKNITTKDAANEWLRSNFPNYEVVEWGGNGQSKDTLILDKSRNVKFSYAFMRFKDKIQKNPDRQFGLSKTEVVAKARKAMIDKYGVSSPLQIEEFKNKAENTTLERYGVKNVMLDRDFVSEKTSRTKEGTNSAAPNKSITAAETKVHHTKTPEFKQKLKNLLLEKYGVDNVFKVKEFQDKAKSTMIEKYGKDHPSKVKEIHERQLVGIRQSSDSARKKREETMIQRYGDSNPRNIDSINNKIIRTNIQRYGVDNPQKNEEVKKKTIDTNRKTYGSDHFFSSEEGKKKAIESKIKNGQVKTHDGKLLSKIAEEKEYSSSHFRKLVRENGLEEAMKAEPNKTFLESKMSGFLSELNIEFIFNKQLNGCKYKPDFVIESHKLIIECDGLYWHSDKYLTDRNYHKRKLETYESLGYRALFFRSDEIEKSFEIVKSIISNQLRINCRKVFARKCELKLLEKEGTDFISQNHLMGPGKGRVYGLVFHGEILATLQIKCTSADTRSYEISRFCTKNNVSVPGGFSRLLNFAKNNENPKFITTFVDRRYGNGSYLLDLKFKKSNSHISFKWTNGYETLGRMTFPGNSGLNEGLSRIYDAGQQKYVIEF